MADKNVMLVGSQAVGKTTLIEALYNAAKRTAVGASLRSEDGRRVLQYGYENLTWAIYDFDSPDAMLQMAADGMADAALLVIHMANGPEHGIHDLLFALVDEGVEFAGAALTNLDALEDDEDLCYTACCEVRELFDEIGLDGDEMRLIMLCADAAADGKEWALDAAKSLLSMLAESVG